MILIHSTLLFVAFVGNNVAVNVAVSLISKVKEVLLREIEVTSITSGAGLFTVTVQNAILPLFASAVIVVEPSVFAVILPLLTDAADGFVLDQVIVLSVA